MSVELKQSSRATGSTEWAWSVWIEGSAEELANVDHVIYHLHPTFADPIRTVRDRKTKFRLDETGWGEFEIVAHVIVKKRAQHILKAWLTLGAPPKASPRVFISSSVADANWAEALTRELEKQDVRVLSTRDVYGSDLPASLERTLRTATGAVMLVSDKESPWVDLELKQAKQLGLRTVRVEIGAVRKTSKPNVLGVKVPSDVAAVAKQIVKTFSTPTTKVIAVDPAIDVPGFKPRRK